MLYNNIIFGKYSVLQVVIQTLICFILLTFVSFVAPITQYDSGYWNKLGFVPTYCSPNDSTILECLTNSSYLLYSSYYCSKYKDTVNIQCNVQTGDYKCIYCCLCCLRDKFTLCVV